MGGATLEWADGGAGRVLGVSRPRAAVPDSSTNNTADPAAARAVYAWLLSQRVPTRIVTREAICELPMRLFSRKAAECPHDPIVRFISGAQEAGLVSLWRRICRGEVPGRDKRWFFGCARALRCHRARPAAAC